MATKQLDPTFKKMHDDLDKWIATEKDSGRLTAEVETAARFVLMSLWECAYNTSESGLKALAKNTEQLAKVKGNME